VHVALHGNQCSTCVVCCATRSVEAQSGVDRSFRITSAVCTCGVAKARQYDAIIVDLAENVSVPTGMSLVIGLNV
jgi:hypothetical protein